MNSLLEIIAHHGNARVAAALGVDESTIAQVKRRRTVSASLLARAKGRYGEELDVEATLRELRSEDYALGRAAAASASMAPEPAHD